MTTDQELHAIGGRITLIPFRQGGKPLWRATAADWNRKTHDGVGATIAEAVEELFANPEWEQARKDEAAADREIAGRHWGRT